MGVGKYVGIAAGGVATVVMSRLVVGRLGTAIVVGRYLWKDPTVQKVRKRVGRKIAEASKKATKKNATR